MFFSDMLFPAHALQRIAADGIVCHTLSHWETVIVFVLVRLIVIINNSNVLVIVYGFTIFRLHTDETR